MCRHFDFPFMLQLTGQCAKHLTQISLVLINLQNDPTHPLLCTRNLLPAQTDPNTPHDCGQNCIKGHPSLGGWATVWGASCKRQGGTVRHAGWREFQFSDVEDENQGVQVQSLLSRVGQPPVLGDNVMCPKWLQGRITSIQREEPHQQSTDLFLSIFPPSLCQAERRECTVLAQGASQRADGRSLWSSTEIRSIQPT